MHSSIKSIKSNKDLSKYIMQLRQNLKENPEEWENLDLDSFLEAMAAWVDDSDGYFCDTNQKLPKDEEWQLVATVLSASKIYE